MNCVKCGAEHAPEDLNCPNCGHANPEGPGKANPGNTSHLHPTPDAAPVEGGGGAPV